MEKNILERKIEQLTDNLTLEVAEYEWIVQKCDNIIKNILEKEVPYTDMTTFAMRKLLMRKNKDQHYYKLIRDDDWK